VVEVTVAKDGKLSVDRVTCVLDCYHVANPNTVAQQMEGAVIMGLTAALWGEITIKDGAPVQTNFHNYRMAAFAETPAAHRRPPSTHLGGERWGGSRRTGPGPARPRAWPTPSFAAHGKRCAQAAAQAWDLSWA
jgi:hypothetical protein